MIMIQYFNISADRLSSLVINNSYNLRIPPKTMRPKMDWPYYWISKTDVFLRNSCDVQSIKEHFPQDKCLLDEINGILVFHLHY